MVPSRKTVSDHGFSLLEVLLAAGLVSLITVGIGTATKKLFQSTKRIELKSDLASIKQSLSEQIDCAATLNGISFATQCGSTSAMNGQNGGGITYLRLKGRSQGTAYDIPGTWDGTALKVGDWSIRTTCSLAENTLVVRAARPQGATFYQDPMTKETLGWYTHRRALLFGSGAGTLCSAQIGATAMGCGANQVMRGFNADGTPACVTLSGHAFTGFGCNSGSQVVQTVSAAGGATSTGYGGANCVDQDAACPSGQTKVGTSCVPITGPVGANSIAEQLAPHFQLDCRLVTGAGPANGGDSVTCDASEFLAASGVNCTNSAGAAPYGGTTFPGYVHQLKITSTTALSVDCYHFPTGAGWDNHNDDNGKATAYGICCKRKPIYVP